MPWSNNTGGGDNKGPWGNQNGNGGGPWGGGPSGRGGNEPPDLEEMFRRGQDKIKRVLPGGGGGGGHGGGLPGILSISIIGILVLGLWLFQCFYQLTPDQRGVELIFGKPKDQISESGLHFHFWPVETVEIVSITENGIVIGGVSTRGAAAPGLMLSGDQNIVEVAFKALWQVEEPAAFLFNVADAEGMVAKVVESAMREVVGRRPADDIFRDDKAGVSEEVRVISQNILNSYDIGVKLNRVTLENVAPPPEVAGAFDEVQRAEQDEDRFVEEGNAYKNEKLGAARGDAAQEREAAAAYKKRIVEEAVGESQRFISVYNEYAKAPEVTRKRLFLETMERVLKGSDKVILGGEGSGSGVVPYLPLPEIQKRANPTAARGQ